MQEDIEQRISAIYHTHYQDVYYFLLLLLHFTGNQNDAEDLTRLTSIASRRSSPFSQKTG
ncbi:hypothetical protein [Brevibacillus sp. HB1.3]|uniref:hypothetical protein n=1 Tax=Brevibacillus sp. HB1.3 TaxID=2738842 RepID=UPI0020A6C2B7|nr:hypothetical protein [Brevibacillus sp. HB1.3]